MRRASAGRKAKPLVKAKGYFYGKSQLRPQEDFSVDGAYEQLVAYRSEAASAPTKMLVSLYADRMKLKRRLKSGAVAPYESYPLEAIERYFSFAIDPRLLILGVRAEHNFYALFAFHAAEPIDAICDIVDSFKAGRAETQAFLLSDMAGSAAGSLDRLQRKIVLPGPREADSKRLAKSASDVTERDSLETLRDHSTDACKPAKVMSASDYATDTDESSYGLNAAESMQDSFPKPSGAVETVECAAQAVLEEDPLPVLVEAHVHIDSGCIVRREAGGRVRTSVGEGRMRIRGPAEGLHDAGEGLDIDIHIPDILDSRARRNPQLERRLFVGGEDWDEQLTYIHSDPDTGAHPCSEGSLYMYVAHPARKEKEKYNL